MTQHDSEHSQPEQTRDRAPSEPVASPTPLQSLAAVIGNRAFTAGVVPAAGDQEKAETRSAGAGPGGSRLLLHQLLREAVEAELGNAWEPRPRVRGGRERAIQRLAPQASVLGAIAQAGFTADQATGSAIKNPRAVLTQLASAVASAWSSWQSATTIVGVQINGPVATGGIVVGPPLHPLIFAGAPTGTPAEKKLSNAVASAVGGAFLMWQASVKIPGLPLYPAFAAFPSPVAPPMPNVPFPLLQMVQVPPSGLGASIAGIFGDPADQVGNAICTALGSAIETVFPTWLASTLVTNILGTGPIPTFAPPYVPVGPVVGGVGTMTPGGFI